MTGSSILRMWSLLLLNFSYIYKDAVTLATELMLAIEKIGDVTENSVAAHLRKHCLLGRKMNLNTLQ